jgi:NAD(P)H-dependent FMN reductase
MKLLAFSLSLRQQSLNTRLLQQAISMLQAQGVEVEILDLNHYDLPAYNMDKQMEGFPEAAVKFKDKLSTAAGFVLACPEFNYAYPGSFKNLFDWISRFQPMPWAQKSGLFLSASPSPVGGNRALWQLRIPFEGCGSFIFPEMFSLASAHAAFTAEGDLVDATVKARLTQTVAAFVRFAQGLA